EETAAQGLGKADFFSVYEVIHPPDWSDAKRRAIEDTREHINPSRVSFLQTVGLPLVLGNREGIHIQDLDAREPLIDLHCNGGVFNLGHRNAGMLKALQLASERLDIGNHHFLSAERGKLAARLAQLLPGDMSQVVFGTSGGESVDLAIKLACSYTKRRK